MAHEYAQTAADEWVSFPGGELEGKRPKALCSACRDTLKREALAARGRARPSGRSRPLCFQCYRAELDREGALAAAGTLDTASDARFQCQLPLEPVNTARLAMLKVERAESRAAASVGLGPYVDKRRQAQIAARHALQAIAKDLAARRLMPATSPEAARTMDAAIHAAELQLPESWLPFVVSR
jgi:hypothetical protein